MYRLILFFVTLSLVPNLLLAGDLRGKVVIVGEHDEPIPAVGVDVTIDETGDSGKTKAGGLFRIALPDRLKARGSVTLSVNKSGFVIHHPLDGQTPIPTNLDTLVQVRLVPKGSKKLWSDDRLEKLIRDTAEKAKSQVQLDVPKEKQESIDFDRYIKDFAMRYGFTPEQVKAEIDKWVQADERKSDDSYRRGLAEYYKKNFFRAYEFARESGERDAKAYEEKVHQTERYREKVIHDFKLAGDAAYNSFLFSDSLRAYTELLRYIGRDESYAWAATKGDIGRSNHAIGVSAGGALSKKHLLDAYDAYRAVLTVVTKEHSTREWVLTQDALSSVLADRAERSDGENAKLLFDEAVGTLRDTLMVATKDKFPELWAMLQHTLGVTLAKRGIHAAGPKSIPLLNQAVTAYREALTVRSEKHLREAWAATQTSLGATFAQLAGHSTERKDKERLYADSVAAYRAALKVFTKEKFPQHWAEVQNNLGATLEQLGEFTEGSKGIGLFNESLTAYNEAATVYTRADLPQQWAMIQNNLGNVLKQMGRQKGGNHGMVLLAQSIGALQAALTIYTKELSPSDWARTQNNLGDSLYQQGLQFDGINGRMLMQHALAAYLAALEVRTSDYDPNDWGQTQGSLGRVYLALNDWEDATKSYRNALTIYPDNTEAYFICHEIYHEKLFLYAEAFALDQEWLRRHPDDLDGKFRFVETHLTTGRHMEARERLKELISSPRMPQGVWLWIRALEIVDLVALGQTDPIVGKLDTLNTLVTSKFFTFAGAVANFEGMKHYINQEERFRAHRHWLLNLLIGLEAIKLDDMLTKIETARREFLSLRHDYELRPVVTP